MSSPGGDVGLGRGAVVDGALGVFGNTGVLGVTGVREQYGLNPIRPRGFVKTTGSFIMNVFFCTHIKKS